MWVCNGTNIGLMNNEFTRHVFPLYPPVSVVACTTEGRSQRGEREFVDMAAIASSVYKLGFTSTCIHYSPPHVDEWGWSSVVRVRHIVLINHLFLQSIVAPMILAMSLL